MILDCMKSCPHLCAEMASVTVNASVLTNYSSYKPELAISTILAATSSMLAISSSYERLLHNANTCKVSITSCSSGSNATHSFTECSCTTPVEMVNDTL